MKEKLSRLLAWPPITHLIAAVTRFSTRLGPQLAAAITYYSVLSFVPILLFIFAVVGMILATVLSHLAGVVKQWIAANLGGVISNTATDPVIDLINGALANWQGIGIGALLMAAYSGSGWIGNLKMSIRVMWHEVAVDEDNQQNPIFYHLSNIAVFFGLVICVIVGVTVAQLGTAGSSLVVGLLGLSDLPGNTYLVHLASVAASFVVSWITVAFLFLTLPDQKVRQRVWLAGVTMVALLITVLLQLAGLISGLLSGNLAALAFGSIILFMVVLNLIATALLIAAAWIGTDPKRKRDLSNMRGQAAEMAASRAAVADAFARSQSSSTELIKREVAEKGARASMNIGYGIGAATGAGVGAVLAVLVGLISRLVRRR